MSWAGIDWGQVVQIAPTAVIISTIVTLLIRWFDRPRAVLRTEVRLTQVPAGSDQRSFGAAGTTVSARVALMNVGDGDAYDVKVFGSKCDPAIQVEPHNWVYSLPVVRAGETEIVVVAGSDDPNQVEDAAVIITWSPRPKRWPRKLMRIPFAETNSAELLPPGTLPVRVIPACVRSTRRLESMSPRAIRYRGRERGSDLFEAPGDER